MVRHHDGVGAELDREPGVIDIENAFDDQLAGPIFLDPLDVLPRQRRIELRGDPDAESEMTFSMPFTWPARLPKVLRLPIRMLQAQAGLLAISMMFLTRISGGTVMPFLMSRWRWPSTCKSTVSTSALHLAAAKGDRVKITMSGKFLPFKYYGATGNALAYGLKEE